MNRTNEIDMCSGPVTGKIVRFAIPLMLSGMLQLLFNAADVIVVGRYCGSVALAAVGSNGAVINLTVNLFVGISVGTNVLVARSSGRQHADSVFRAVHSAILLSFLLGIFTGVFGAVYAPQVLRLLSVPDDILILATLYLRIYFIGIPATVVYNFGAAILRAVGDTKNPLYFLTAAGILNVICNLLLVLVFHLDVAGVAIASALSQYLAAALVLRCLMRKESSCRLSLRMLRLYKRETLEMVRIGIPAGLQSTIFSISNVLIQSAINVFGAAVIAGNAAGANLDQLVYIAMNAFHHAAVSFISQNTGAGKTERISKIAVSCCLLVCGVGIVLGGLFYLLGNQLLSIYTKDADIIAAGMIRLRWVCLPYFLCGLMDVGCGIVRGLGHAWLPMIVSTLGACVLRIIWIYTIFAWNPRLDILYSSYPISWLLTAAVHLICAAVLLRYLKLRHQPAFQGMSDFSTAHQLG
ncbi:MAG: MATE family efflux transporter [Oscillospiraceae bacterium]|nr:MATE family efflux transporter [Oscillospiraceae bacterium]